MKPKIKVNCVAYENAVGSQIKAETQSFETEASALAYAGKFLKSLDAKNAVKISFNFDEERYVIDADKLENAVDKIATMSKSYNVTDTAKFEVGKIYKGLQTETGTMEHVDVEMKVTKIAKRYVTFECNGKNFSRAIQVDSNGEFVEVGRTKFNDWHTYSLIFSAQNEVNATETLAANPNITFVDNDNFYYAMNRTHHLNKLIKGKRITLISQDDEDERYKFRKGYELKVAGNAEGFSIELYQGARAFEDNVGNTFLAEYKTVEAFNAAIREFELAIKRGDKEFVFPADGVSKVEMVDVETDGSEDEPEEEPEMSITSAAMTKIEAEAPISTAELEKQLSALEKEIRINKLCQRDKIIQVEGKQKEILNCLKQIAYYTDRIWEINVEYSAHGNKIAELETQAEKINAELLSRQFSAEVLNSAINAAENVTEVTPVTFDLQNFNSAEITIAENTATIDTSVTSSEIPIIDEDAEFDARTKEIEEEIASYDAEIAKLQAKLKNLEERKWQAEHNLKKHFGKLKKFVQDTVKFSDKKIGVKTQRGRTFILTEKDIENLNFDDYFEEGVIRITLKTASGNEVIGKYQTVKEFKTAIYGLAEALEHGDTEFTFK